MRVRVPPPAPFILSQGTAFQMNQRYLMTAGSGSTELEVRKSRFIGHVARAATEDEARAVIARISKEHWNASHNCYAWSLGVHPRLQRSGDDGEPFGTAGIPMLEVLKQRDLTDTVLVVTRYFGGTKLGAGGLIRAYSGAASAVIDLVGIAERKQLTRFGISVSFEDAGRLENALRAGGDDPHEVDYSEHVSFTMTMDPARQPDFLAWVAEQTSGRARIEHHEAVFAEVPFAPSLAATESQE